MSRAASQLQLPRGLEGEDEKVGEIEPIRYPRVGENLRTAID